MGRTRYHWSAMNASRERLTCRGKYWRCGASPKGGDYGDLSRRYPEAPVIGSPNHIVMPGLVNDHFHVGLTPHGGA